jgi:hypothetical protein
LDLKILIVLLQSLHQHVQGFVVLLCEKEIKALEIGSGGRQSGANFSPRDVTIASREPP